MHEWFAQPIAAARMATKREHATAHRLRVMRGRDLSSRLTTPMVKVAARGATRLRRRRAMAAAAVSPACC